MTVDSTDVVVPCTVRFPVIIVLPVRVGLVTIPTVIVSPDTDVSISLAVPTTERVSDNKLTQSSVPESAAILRTVATVTVLAAVNLPCWSTVNVGIAVVLP